jgi:hypothetical protein
MSDHDEERDRLAAKRRRRELARAIQSRVRDLAGARRYDLDLDTYPEPALRMLSDRLGDLAYARRAAVNRQRREPWRRVHASSGRGPAIAWPEMGDRARAELERLLRDVAQATASAVERERRRYGHPHRF